MPRRFTSDELATLRRIAYEDELISPRLNPGTLAEKANVLRPRMVRTAEEKETVTYSELTNDFTDLSRFDIGAVLGAIGLVEDREGRPLLPAVVVQANTGWPGHNYFGLVELAEQVSEPVPPESEEEVRRWIWAKHRERVWSYDWDAQTEREKPVAEH